MDQSATYNRVHRNQSKRSLLYYFYHFIIFTLIVIICASTVFLIHQFLQMKQNEKILKQQIGEAERRIETLEKNKNGTNFKSSNNISNVESKTAMSLLDKVVDLVNKFNNLANRANHMFDDLKAKINSVTLAINEVDENLKMEIVQRSNETNFLKSFAERNLALNENLQSAINITFIYNTVIRNILANEMNKTRMQSPINESEREIRINKVLRENIAILFKLQEFTATPEMNTFKISYQNSQDLLFLITCDQNSRIRYRTINFNTELRFDFLIVIDGSVKKKYTGQSSELDGGITSATSSLLFFFHSYHSGQRDDITIEFREELS
ncbi:hypothetical protein B4U79_18198 [Dinothrombium tinctorium]|uniref:CUB domain-containing protein n=1 Tax=Dinothrombium tinctorium TaxID=1965070 RepID=A0A443QXH9_9ACAR|nr:hypothetical protein B4U79_18198 [Dinothrombium tinctorium]